MTTFIRLLEHQVDEKPEKLLRAVARLREEVATDEASVHRTFFECEPTVFGGVPGSPFAYWVSAGLRGAFRRFESFEARSRSVKQGLATADDFRFVRTWWEIDSVEVEAAKPRWFGFAKGGDFSPFYADVYLAVSWSNGGAEMYAFNGIPFGTSGAPMRNPKSYFRPGLTYPLRTQRGLGMRAMPARCVFGHKGPAAFMDPHDSSQLLALLAIATSSTFRCLVQLQMTFGSYEVGVIQRTPVPGADDGGRGSFASLARRAWSLKRSLDTTNETSHAFVLPASTFRLSDIDPLPELPHSVDREVIERELVEIQREIDDRAFALYGISEEDRRTIEGDAKRDAAPEAGVDEGEADPEEDSDQAVPELPMLASNSWHVGVAFGRFDKRLATGERPIPPEPEPFDPLPSHSPGMWPEGDPRPPPPDILADDPGTARDLTEHVVQAMAGSRIGGTPEPREWLAHEFFPLHIKMYSKSRRKAPIYWQLAPPSASYSVWLYIHAFTKDTLYKVQNDYVAPKVAHEERKLESLRGETGPSAKVGDRKALAEQETFVDELRAFLDEVKRVAPLWNPNLDDGVIINFAPLWRLVPHHKPWQKELKTTWDALCAGDYDWAHLAMHLWPERVVPKCLTDRSLAIAHGLEEDLWVEGDGGKWKARVTPKRPLEELVRERSSAAVKAALKGLLEAPIAGGAVKRGRKGKRDA